MKKIKVWFLDWYDVMLPGTSVDNIFLYLLKMNYEVVLDQHNPDVLFYGLNYNQHLNYSNCFKIFVCSEPGPVSPEQLYKFESNSRYLKSINDADLMITSYKIDDDKYFYFPHFMMWLYFHVKISKVIDSFESLTKPKNFTEEDIKNRKFCAFLHYNPNPEKRKELFYRLNEYKIVDSNLFNKNVSLESYYNSSSYGGSYHKINFIKNYKFTFAMQNFFWKVDKTYTIPGTFDEKILEPFLANSIPLFYGNEEVTNIFNKYGFINWHEFDSDDKFIKRIIEVDNNDKLYLEMLNQPAINDLSSLRMNELAEHLKKIIG